MKIELQVLGRSDPGLLKIKFVARPLSFFLLHLSLPATPDLFTYLLNLSPSCFLLYLALNLADTALRDCRLNRYC